MEKQIIIFFEETKKEIKKIEIEIEKSLKEKNFILSAHLVAKKEILFKYYYKLSTILNIKLEDLTI